MNSKPKTQTEYNVRRAALVDRMLVMLRNDLLKAEGKTEEQVCKEIIAEARMLLSVTSRKGIGYRELVRLIEDMEENNA